MNTSLREIKKFVIANEGTYKKCNFYLNTQDSYRINGKLMTKKEMIKAYNQGYLMK